MRAKITSKNVSNGRNYFGEKELVNSMHLIAVLKGEILEIATARFWMGRSRNASTVYCSIWVNDRKTGTFAAGNGAAGGYGYHKESAALASALSSAGIELYGSPYVAGSGKTRRSHWDNDTQQTVYVPVSYKERAHIGGVGETAMKDAIEAIGRALGYRKFKVV